MTRRGAGPMAWIIGLIIALTVVGLGATIAVSARYDVASGYIPPEAR